MYTSRLRKHETLSRIQLLFLTPSLLYCSLKQIEHSAEVSTNPRPKSIYIYIYIYIDFVCFFSDMSYIFVQRKDILKNNLIT